MVKTVPDFSFELAAQARGFLRIAGVDEVGRGPLCGPVTAAAVILDPARIPAGLGDSKALSENARQRLDAEIRASAVFCIAHATVEEIDRLNILHASMLAMRRAIDGLGERADFALIDGNRVPKDLACESQPVVKGDARVLSIAAASIIAKVARDRIMVELSQQYPGYGWEKNAGYPTKLHLDALLNLGVTPAHRRSFKPIHKMLYQGISASH